MTPIHGLGAQDELLVHHPEKLGERLDGGRHDSALDTGDRGLGGPGADRELALGQAVPAPGFAQELSGRHEATISDEISCYPRRMRDGTGTPLSPVAKRRSGV